MARLIALAGPPGVGKSAIARELARRTGAVWLRIDSMDQAIWASGTAPEDLRDWTYRAAQAIALDNLALGRDVIADCVNNVAEARAGWDACGRAAGADIRWVRVDCSDAAEHQRRVETRVSDIRGLKLPDWAAVAARPFEPMPPPHLAIDTAGLPLEAAVEAALAAFSG